MMRATFALPAADPQVDDTLDLLRARGVRLIGIAGLAATLVLILLAFALEHGASPALLTVAVLINVAPAIALFRRRHDAQARIIIGTHAATLPAMLVFILRDNAWQMDAHMYFFVALAALTVMCDWRPIAVASLLIAVHHLALEYAAPSWVFSTRGDIGRVLFHAFAVLLQCAVLAWVTRLLRRLLEAQGKALIEQRTLVALADAERLRASEALADAQAAHASAASERTRRKAAEQRAAVERQAELVILAAEFERSVTEVAKAIHTSSTGLQNLAIRLDEVAASADGDAIAASSGAEDTAREIRQVAAAIGSLSASIQTIAVAASHQAELTMLAQQEGALSTSTISALEAHVEAIDSFIDDIRATADKTNLLALNAAIEAARAGDSGRGFGVVAGEVKSLAADTARLSDRIRGLLGNIRIGVRGAAREINAATNAVRDLAGAADEIASAVTEQNGHAGDIDRSARSAAAGADQIEQQMHGVVEAIATTLSLSTQMRGDAVTLATSARDLRASTQRFVSFLRDTDIEVAI